MGWREQGDAQRLDPLDKARRAKPKTESGNDNRRSVATGVEVSQQQQQILLSAPVGHPLIHKGYVPWRAFRPVFGHGDARSPCSIRPESSSPVPRSKETPSQDAGRRLGPRKASGRCSSAVTAFEAAVEPDYGLAFPRRVRSE